MDPYADNAMLVKVERNTLEVTVRCVRVYIKVQKRKDAVSINCNVTMDKGCFRHPFPHVLSSEMFFFTSQKTYRKKIWITRPDGRRSKGFRKKSKIIEVSDLSVTFRVRLSSSTSH